MNKKVKEYLEGIPGRLRKESEKAELLDDPSTKGELREDFIKIILKDHFPSVFSLSSGKIFDALGGVSKQQDVILYFQNKRSRRGEPVSSRLVLPLEN